MIFTSSIKRRLFKNIEHTFYVTFNLLNFLRLLISKWFVFSFCEDGILYYIISRTDLNVWLLCSIPVSFCFCRPTL